MSNFNQLRSFVTVAEAGSISRAAERLYVAQPALSLQLKRLESDLGVQLFTRLPRGVELTSEGEQLLGIAESALRSLEQLEDTAAHLRNQDVTEIVVGFMAHGAGDLTPGILRRMRESHPSINFRFRQFDFEDPSVGLSRGLVDVGFLSGPCDAVDSIESVVLREEPIVAAVSTEHPLASRRSIGIEELLAFPVITDGLTEGAWHDFWIATRYHKPNQGVETVSFSSHDESLDAVALSLGVSICPESTQRFYPRPGVAFIPMADMDQAPLNLLWRTDRETPLVRAFIASAEAAAHELRASQQPKQPLP